MRVITIAATALVALGVFAAVEPAFVARAQQAQDAETRLWRAARTCSDFQAYLRAYPDGRYKAQALAEASSACAADSEDKARAGDRSSSDTFGSSSSARDEPTGRGRQTAAAEATQRAAEAERDAQQRAAAERQAAAERDMLRELGAAQSTGSTREGERESATRGFSLERRPAGGPPSASAPPVALPAGYEIVSHVLTPTESYLPKRDGMPTGIVLLDVREKAKNQNLCKALLGARTATVKTEAQARRDNPNGDFLVTNWPVTGPVAHEDDCGELLANYDFDRAARVKGAYALTGSHGPFFLALDPTGEIVFLDLKDASAEEVFKATSDWMKLALASPQNRPAAEQRLGLVAGTNQLFARLAGGFGSLVGANPAAPTLIRFNDPVKGTARQFNIYKAGVYLIGATFAL